MRKNNPRGSPDISDMRSAFSGKNEKLELSFGKELMKDDDALSQHTFKSQTTTRNTMKNSPSSPAKLFTSFMPPRSPTVVKKAPLKPANRKIKVFKRDFSPSKERDIQSAVVLPKTIAPIQTVDSTPKDGSLKDTFAGSQQESVENPFGKKNVDLNSEP